MWIAGKAHHAKVAVGQDFRTTAGLQILPHVEKHQVRELQKESPEFWHCACREDARGIGMPNIQSIGLRQHALGVLSQSHASTSIRRSPGRVNGHQSSHDSGLWCASLSCSRMRVPGGRLQIDHALISTNRCLHCWLKDLSNSFQDREKDHGAGGGRNFRGLQLGLNQLPGGLQLAAFGIA